MAKPHPELDKRLAALLDVRRNPLTEEEDELRKACRDMLRIGSYKPTGRGKPSSEYLLRSALEEDFPRINTVVDINNYVSLKYLVPISLWDTGKIEADSWLFRTGKPDESFVFNPSGQEIALEDLVTGFAVLNGKETPILTPIKDCQQTKTDASTREVAAGIYYPAGWNGPPELQKVVDEFAELLEMVSGRVTGRIVDGDAG